MPLPTICYELMQALSNVGDDGILLSDLAADPLFSADALQLCVADGLVVVGKLKKVTGAFGAIWWEPGNGPTAAILLPRGAGELAAWKLAGGPAAETAGQAGKTTRRKKRGGKSRKPRPPTARQTEVIQIVGECKGNLAEAARRLGRNRKTIEETYRAGLARLGMVAVWHDTKLLPRDRRGQAAVSADDDGRR